MAIPGIGNRAGCAGPSAGADPLLFVATEAIAEQRFEAD